MGERVDLPTKQYAGYIFDLDGTLVDSMPLHYRAWREALRRAGAPYEAFLEDEFYSCGGKSAHDVVEYLNKKYSCKMPMHETADLKRALYLEMLAAGKLEPIAEVVDFVRAMGPGAPVAIATGSAIPGASRTLRSAGIEDLFPIVVTPEDVVHGKPAPDIFLEAARRLGADPSRCVVFEDAQPGIQGAIAAGMDYVVVRRPKPSAE